MYKKYWEGCWGCVHPIVKYTFTPISFSAEFFLLWVYKMCWEVCNSLQQLCLSQCVVHFPSYFLLGWKKCTKNVQDVLRRLQQLCLSQCVVHFPSHFLLGWKNALWIYKMCWDGCRGCAHPHCPEQSLSCFLSWRLWTTIMSNTCARRRLSRLSLPVCSTP